MAGSAARAPRGRIAWTTIDSRVLRGNRLGDPHQRTFPVYLPPGYDDTSVRYPVLLALAGYTGTGRMMLNASAWGEPLDARLDRLHAEGRIGPMIVVMPDCMTRYGGSQYLNSSATGRYADHLVHDVVPHVDRNFRTLATPRHRGLFGKSSGGYGAIVHGMLHPHVFGAVACHSGDMAFEYCYGADFPKFLEQMAAHGGPQRFLAAFETAPRKTRAMVEALNILAMAACYGPDPRRRPLGIAWPMDLTTGAIDLRVWSRWLNHDPLRMAQGHVAALRRLRLLYLDCGRRDEFNLLWGARQLTAELRRLRVAHLYEEFDDGHMDVSYRFDRSLPRLWEALRPAARPAAGPAARRRSVPRPR
jgi:enterochelin esterase family protein